MSPSLHYPLAKPIQCNPISLRTVTSHRTKKTYTIKHHNVSAIKFTFWDAKNNIFVTIGRRKTNVTFKFAFNNSIINFQQHAFSRTDGLVIAANMASTTNLIIFKTIIYHPRVNNIVC